MPVKNRDLSIGSEFMHRSFYDIASLQIGKDRESNLQQQPLPCKLYQNVDHYPLQAVPPLTLGDARWSFHAFRQMKSDQSIPNRDSLDEESLSTLIYYTYGFSRHDEGPGVAWPFHRFVPSARCLFPAELYLWLPQVGQIPSGLYAYDAHHHRLALLRPGDACVFIGQALDASLDHCLGILLISALFWKTAFKYLNFAYRLCTQEVGLVAGNALLVAGTLGMQSHIHYQFLDQVLNRLLGFDAEEESLMAVLPLYPAENAHQQVIQRTYLNTTSQVLSDVIAPIDLQYLKRSVLDRERCASLITMNQHSLLETTTEIVSVPYIQSIICNISDKRISPCEPLVKPIDLAQALYIRNSGDVHFTPRRVMLPHHVFWEIVRYSLSPYVSDTRQMYSAPQLSLYIVINAVEGMDQGIYRFCSHCNMLHVIAHCDIALTFQAIQTQDNITCTSANMLCYIVGEYSATSNIFGNRAYRLLHMETGIIAQRLCVMSAAYGLTARYSNSYKVAPCKMLLRLASSDAMPLAEIVIGVEQPGAHGAHRYRFSLFC
jgi:SagB-type dehydrogenase family enzyme